MVVAALGIVGYTFLDKIAAEVVQSGPGTAARYGYFYFAISFFPYLLLMCSMSTTHEKVQNPGWRLPIKGKDLTVRISGALLITAGLVRSRLWGLTV